MKPLALDTICKISGLDEQKIDFTIKNLKRLQNSKYKKMLKFKLKKFINEIESESLAESLKQKEVLNVDEATNSETFKLIQKEDWIPEAIKANLKCLKDYLNYLLKSLKTVKSKIFYDKLATYLNSLFK